MSKQPEFPTFTGLSVPPANPVPMDLSRSTSNSNTSAEQAEQQNNNELLFSPQTAAFFENARKTFDDLHLGDNFEYSTEVKNPNNTTSGFYSSDDEISPENTRSLTISARTKTKTKAMSDSEDDTPPPPSASVKPVATDPKIPLKSAFFHFK